MQLSRLAALVLVLSQLATPALATHDDPRRFTRLYLMAADDEFYYWTVDPDDPALTRTRTDRSCAFANTKGLPGYRDCQLTFFQAADLGAPIQWSSGSPLRYHLALDVRTLGTPTVRMSQGTLQSDPATEVATGVWEGTIRWGGPIADDRPETFTLSVASDVPDVTYTLRTAGASWIDIPTAVPARAVPELVERGPGRGAPAGRYESAQRSFMFNDDRWRVTTFTGDLQQAREFPVTVAEDAELVLAWVELFDQPILQDLAAGRQPDSRKLTDSAQAELYRDGERIARGQNGGLYGLGSDTVAHLDVPAGPLLLKISPTYVWPTNFQQGHPYRAYVLEVSGERTVRSMRWLSMFADYPGMGPHNSPFTASCPGVPTEILPVPDQVTTYAVDMDVSTVNPLARWSVAFELGGTSYVCGDGGTGDEVRFTSLPPGIHRVGPMVAQDTTSSEWRSTVFEWEATFSYTRPPRPDDHA